MGEAERRVLLDVGDARVKARAVADRRLHFLRRVAHDDGDVLDAGVADGLDAVEEDRLVGDGHQLLGAGVRDGAQASAASAGENERFDGVPSFRPRQFCITAYTDRNRLVRLTNPMKRLPRITPVRRLTRTVSPRYTTLSRFASRRWPWSS